LNEFEAQRRQGKDTQDAKAYKGALAIFLLPVNSVVKVQGPCPTGTLHPGRSSFSIVPFKLFRKFTLRKLNLCVRMRVEAAWDMCVPLIELKTASLFEIVVPTFFTFHSITFLRADSFLRSSSDVNFRSKKNFYAMYPLLLKTDNFLVYWSLNCLFMQFYPYYVF
jgi:hypothetical protein